MPPFCPRTAVNSQHPSPTARSEPEVNPSVDLYDAAWRTLVMRRSSARAAWRRSGRPSTANRREGLQFGLQFTAVRCRPRRTGQGGWSSLNRSGRSRPELLMRLGFTPFRGSNPRASAAHGPSLACSGEGACLVPGPKVAVALIRGHQRVTWAARKASSAWSSAPFFHSRQ